MKSKIEWRPISEAPHDALGDLLLAFTYGNRTVYHAISMGRWARYGNGDQCWHLDRKMKNSHVYAYAPSVCGRALAPDPLKFKQ